MAAHFTGGAAQGKQRPCFQPPNRAPHSNLQPPRHARALRMSKQSQLPALLSSLDPERSYDLYTAFDQMKLDRPATGDSNIIANNNREMITNVLRVTVACTSYEQAYAGAARNDFTLIERTDIIAAYYNLCIIAGLNHRSLQKSQLERVSKKHLDGMEKMTRYLVFKCSEAILMQ
ncbi:MAG: hypothetical protein ASARMPRED_002777 [Alectoria sarmentosa]|nr:MAG: hypothetical protein ASARMPRED_002777 [Alectoria sarmentosa]